MKKMVLAEMEALGLDTVTLTDFAAYTMGGRILRHPDFTHPLISTAESKSATPPASFISSTSFLPTFFSLPLPATTHQPPFNAFPPEIILTPYRQGKCWSLPSNHAAITIVFPHPLQLTNLTVTNGLNHHIDSLRIAGLVLDNKGQSSATTTTKANQFLQARKLPLGQISINATGPLYQTLPFRSNTPIDAIVISGNGADMCLYQIRAHGFQPIN